MFVRFSVGCVLFNFAFNSVKLLLSNNDNSIVLWFILTSFNPKCQATPGVPPKATPCSNTKLRANSLIYFRTSEPSRLSARFSAVRYTFTGRYTDGGLPRWTWFEAEDGRGMFLRNVGTQPKHYTAQQPRTPYVHLYHRDSLKSYNDLQSFVTPL